MRHDPNPIFEPAAARAKDDDPAGLVGAHLAARAVQRRLVLMIGLGGVIAVGVLAGVFLTQASGAWPAGRELEGGPMHQSLSWSIGIVDEGARSPRR